MFPQILHLSFILNSASHHDNQPECTLYHNTMWWSTTDNPTDWRLWSASTVGGTTHNLLKWVSPLRFTVSASQTNSWVEIIMAPGMNSHREKTVKGFCGLFFWTLCSHKTTKLLQNKITYFQHGKQDLKLAAAMERWRAARARLYQKRRWLSFLTRSGR